MCFVAWRGAGFWGTARQIGDRSSEFYPDVNEIRRDGSYIYEAFVETQGTDVKVIGSGACRAGLEGTG